MLNNFNCKTNLQLKLNFSRNLINKGYKFIGKSKIDFKMLTRVIIESKI